MKSASTEDIVTLAAYYDLPVSQAMLRDKNVTGAQLLQMVARVSESLLDLGLDEDDYFAMAALVGLVRFIDKLGVLPCGILGGAVHWMSQRNGNFDDLVETFTAFGVLEIALPVLEPSYVSLLVHVKAERVRELVREFQDNPPAYFVGPGADCGWLCSLMDVPADV